MNFKDIQKMVSDQLEEHASTILTAGGVIGTVATAVLAGRAGFKAAELIADQYLKYDEEKDEIVEPSKRDQFLLVAPLFVPPALAGAATVASIVGANYMSAKEVAALAAAYGYSQKNLDEYKAKIAEKLTGPKNQQIRDEIAQDRVTNNPPSGNEVIILAGGDVLCYDMITGRYFRSTVEQLHRGAATINKQLLDEQYASLSDFYDQIGLPATNYTDTVGWNMLNSAEFLPLELVLTTTMTPDDKPCIAIDFNTMPKPDYARSY